MMRQPSLLSSLKLKSQTSQHLPKDRFLLVASPNVRPADLASPRFLFRCTSRSCVDRYYLIGPQVFGSTLPCDVYNRYCLVLTGVVSKNMPSFKARLQRAAKARVDRMCKNHGKRKDLNVPEWLKNEWKTGKRDQIAQVLQDCNWDKDTPSASSHMCTYKYCTWEKRQRKIYKADHNVS